MKKTLIQRPLKNNEEIKTLEIKENLSGYYKILVIILIFRAKQPNGWSDQ